MSMDLISADVVDTKSKSNESQDTIFFINVS